MNNKYKKRSYWCINKQIKQTLCTTSMHSRHKRFDYMPNYKILVHKHNPTFNYNTFSHTSKTIFTYMGSTHNEHRNKNTVKACIMREQLSNAM